MTAMTLGAVACCRSTEPDARDAGQAEDAGDAGQREDAGDGGQREDAGDAGQRDDAGDGGVPCVLIDVAEFLAGPTGHDCGDFLILYDTQNARWGDLDAGPFESGVSCVFSDQDAGAPFFLIVERAGFDNHDNSAYVETPDGRFFLLTQSMFPNSPANQGTCLTDIEETSCDPRFFGGTLTGGQGSDAGIPGLACPDSGTVVRYCVGDPSCGQ